LNYTRAMRCAETESRARRAPTGTDTGRF